MTSGLTPPFLHTPYDGSSLPFTVGLKPIGEDVWLEPDAHLATHLAEKERLFAADPGAVFRAEAGTEEAQAEVLALVLDNLRDFHSETYEIMSEEVRIVPASRTISRNTTTPLLTAARLVQEDLVIMREGPDGYRLVAAALCFPSSWSLTEKFGKSMAGIHAPVPGFNEGRMGQVVARLFDNLKTDQLLCRFNWSIYPDAQLHQPLPERVELSDPDHALAQLFLRVERQTLRRLAGSGDILFTIKIHHDPLKALVEAEDRERLSRSLQEQLVSLSDDQLSYKGMTRSRDVLVRALERLAGEG